MKRVSTANGHDRNSQGGDGALPPSTLAAQLVEHHHKTSVQPDSSTFRQLLNEIRASPNAVEVDPAGNQKLIIVVVEAGLSTRDPFLRKEDSYEQIVSCLEVIEIALKRTPEALLRYAKASDVEDVPCWHLLSKIALLMSNDDLRSNCRYFLRSVNRILLRAPGCWNHYHIWRQVLQLAYKDIYDQVSNTSDSHGKTNRIGLSFPSPLMSQILPRPDHQSVAVPRGKHVPVKDVEHAIDIACVFAETVCDAGVSAPDLASTSTASTQWALTQLHTLWQTIYPMFANGTSVSVPVGAVVNLLDSIRRTTNTLALLKAGTIIRRKGADTLFGCLKSFIEIFNVIDERFSDSIFKALIVLMQIESKIWTQERISKLRATVVQLFQKSQASPDCNERLLDLPKALAHAFVSVQAQDRLALVDFTGQDEQGIYQQLLKLSEKIAEDSVRGGVQDEQRPFKRARRQEEQSLVLVDSKCHAILMQLDSLLGSWHQRSITNAVSTFNDLTTAQQIRVFELLGDLSCESVRLDVPETTSSVVCIACGRAYRMKREAFGPDYEQSHHDILNELIRTESVTSSSRLKVAATISIRQWACHTNKLDLLQLESNELGKWCLQGLRSSSREMRVASGQSLTMFLNISDHAAADIARQNRMAALNLLRSLSHASDARTCETLIFAFGQMGLACTEEELNLVLLQLIDYLGHPNTLIASLAFLEIQRVAEALFDTTEELLRPYWRTLAIAVVKDLRKKPNKAQMLADAVGWTTDRLLVETQAFTVPYLVLWGQHEILQRIAKAQGNGTTTFDICVKEPNLHAVLAVLISQHPTNGEAVVQQCLSSIKADIDDSDIAQIFKADPAAVAREILMVAVHSHDDVKQKAVQAFKELALVVERRGHSTRSTTTQARMITLFCDNHALGIVNYLSQSIENPNERIIEKTRSVQGLEQMVSVARGDALVALPQIRACLQAAFDIAELCNVAFDAWVAVLTFAEGEALESLIEQTFTLIVQKWSNFSTTTQQKAYDAVADLLRNYSSLIQGIVDVLPSLAPIPLMSKFESQLSRFKAEAEVSEKLWSFVKRCHDESSLVVSQALRELQPYVEQHQQWIHETAASEQPLPIIAQLIRSLLDTAERFHSDTSGIAGLSAQCLGVIGCVDPNRIESVRESHLPLMISNFKQAGEAIEFVAYFLERVLVKAFQAATNPRAQGFLAYVMQELLKFCGFSKDAFAAYRPQGSQGDDVYLRWMAIPDATRQTLTPFLSSHYVLKTNSSSMATDKLHPIYRPNITHSTWLRDFVLDAFRNAKGDNARMIFDRMARIIRGCDASIVSMLLPYASANIILDGSQGEALGIGKELLAVLRQPVESLTATQASHLEHCSQDVFKVLDYLSRWLQAKKKSVAATRAMIERSGRMMDQMEAEQDRADLQQIANIGEVLQSIPSEIISRRAAACGSFARAILHWEAHMRERADQNEGKIAAEEEEQMYKRLQDIYTNIDEPDGISGVSTHLHILDPEQQAIEHRKAGRWTAAQNWYSLRLNDTPDDIATQVKSLSCLREASQFTSILRQIESAPGSVTKNSTVVSIASEAAWCVNDWRWFDQNVQDTVVVQHGDFNQHVGLALKALRNNNVAAFRGRVQDLRSEVARGLNGSTTSSLLSSRDLLLKLHALYELELVSGCKKPGNDVPLQHVLTRRLDTLGSSHPDKQYLLSLRRAVAQIGGRNEGYNLSASWMTTAKLARKGPNLSLAYNAVYNATRLGDESAKIEQARLLWNEGEHRKAIQSLEGAMATSAFAAAGVLTDAQGNSHAMDTSTNALTSMTTNPDHDPQAQQSMLAAKAQLLKAKWLDQAGQTSSEAVLLQYRQVTFSFQKWEKGLYSLGKFYNKLLDSERALPLSRQSYRTLSGETIKLVVENYLRSLTFGCKYINESLPKLLTLWLDFGIEATRQIPREVPSDIREKANQQRLKFLDGINKQVRKYADKISAFVFYTALAQMITRISHEHQSVWDVLSLVIVRVISTYPQQALWSLLGTVKSSSADRANRGLALLNRIKQNTSKTIRNEGVSVDLRDLITRGQKLSDELLRACEVAIQGRTSHVSIQKDLGFKTKVAPCPLVIPWEKTLTASLPKTNSSRAMRAHKAFPMTREAVTINAFEDSVLVLSSLQKPRKLTARGSDGQRYGLLCKPNDDLRKDQRLMEYNAMINRGLKKDAAASARRLYIKTYSVTPLNERCGIIEWVEGLKPLRDILIALYRAKGVKIDYNLLRNLLNEACANPPESINIFTHQLLDMYFPILHEWFMENFPAPDAWYAARTRYSRSAAVASIVGHTLGLGDRHGENVLLEEENGGVFHVDFNCLFDKGLTFEKPELVPFRLTHNMIDAMGATGVEGYFRKAAEVTLAVMRQQEDALLTILETFVYDPTADFVGRSKGIRVVKVPGINGGLGSNQVIPESPREVLESVRGKLRGMLPGESLPLNVQGYVEALIAMAVDPHRLARMYIGWCAFL